MHAMKIRSKLLALSLAVVALVAAGGIGAFAYFSRASVAAPTAHASSFGATSTVVFGLNVYGYSAKVTGVSQQQVFDGGPITDASGYAINPSDYQSGVPHKIYLNASSFSVDFRLGLEICQPDGTNCHQGWTPWASQIANGTAGADVYSPIVGGGPYVTPATTKCGAPEATLHNRLGDIFLGAETRPLPAGTVLNNVTVTLYPVEYDFNVPVDNAMNPSCWNPYDDAVGVPGTTPIGGGWSNGAFDKWNNASTDGFLLQIQAGATTYDAQPVGSNLPTTVSPSQVTTIGTDGNPLEITMKNTGTSFWPSTRTNTIQGTPSGTCQVSTNGDGILNAPASTTANYGASCTVNYVYAGTLDALAHTSGSFTPSPDPMQYTKIVPITATWVAPTSTTIQRCTTGGAIQAPAAINDAHGGLIPTAYASALPVNGGGIKCFPATVIIPAHYEYAANGASVVAPGDTAQFMLKSLTAPAQTGSYTETWQMGQGGAAFGTPFSTVITVGAGGTLVVTSTNIVTGGPVAGSWNVFGGSLTATSTNLTHAVYSNISFGAGNAVNLQTIPVAASGYALDSVRYSNIAEASSGGKGLLAALRSAFAMRAFAATSQATSAIVCDWSAYYYDSSAGMYACSGGPSPSVTLTPTQSTATSVIMWYPIAAMAVNPTSLILNGSGAGTITVQNTGAPGSSLHWTATTTATWFSLSPAAATTTNSATEQGTTGATAPLTVTASPSLPAGRYSGTVNVVGNSKYCDAQTRQGCSAIPMQISVSFTNTNNGSSSTSTAITGISVACAPTRIGWAATSQCTATVAGGPNASKAVTWSVANAFGSVNANGTYTSPSRDGVATVVATSAQDPSQSGRAQVTVSSALNQTNAPSTTIAANPTSVIVPQATTITYAATNVSSCMLSGGRFATGTPIAFTGTTLNGSATDTPSTNTTYSITCNGTNAFSSVSSSANVTVTVTNPGVHETNP